MTGKTGFKKKSHNESKLSRSQTSENIPIRDERKNKK